MKFLPPLLGPLLTALALGQDAPKATPVPEVPAGAAGADFSGGSVTSSSKQFRVSGGDGFSRGTAAMLAEEAKDDLLRLTEERDDWKVPVNITLHGREGEPMPKRAVAMKLTFSEAGYDLRMDVHVGRGIEPEHFRNATTIALLYERALRGRPVEETDSPMRVPPWLVDGLREATAWRQGRSERPLYEALFKRGGLFKINDLFAMDEAGGADLDGAMRAAFKVSSGALVMALLEQPQGKAGFRALLNRAATFEGEMPALLRNHFPELNLSETSLAKWWALQLANKGTPDATQIYSVAETEAALVEALRVNIRTPEGLVEPRDISAWQEIAALAEAERVEAVRHSQDALARLSYRCFPSYRPLLAEYQLVLGSIARNKVEKVPERLASLAESRSLMVAKTDRARDFLNWFEITRARETSGAFDDYLRLKDRLQSDPHRRGDDLSKYLDRMDAIFHRQEQKPGEATPP